MMIIKNSLGPYNFVGKEYDWPTQRIYNQADRSWAMDGRWVGWVDRCNSTSRAIEIP